MGSKENNSLLIKRALVTGGGGFVGKAIVKQLTALGVETRVVGRNHYPEIDRLGGKCVVGDITDREGMLRISEGMDIVFHVAALAGIWGSWQDYYTTNVVGTETVVDSCRKNNIQMLVYTSTPSVVFNREHIEGGDERLDYATTFLCNYARSKVLAEKIVLAANSESLLTCAIRPHLIWGPGDPHLLPRLMESGRKGMLKRVGDGTNLVDISYIDNVAHAHLLAAKNLSEKGTAAGKAYFVSQGKPVNLWTWINQLFAEMNIPQVNSSLSFPVAYRLGGILEVIYKTLKIKNEPRMTRFLAEQLAKSHYFSTANAFEDLGYEPVVSMEEGLQRTIKWLKSQ